MPAAAMPRHRRRRSSSSGRRGRGRRCCASSSIRTRGSRAARRPISCVTWARSSGATGTWSSTYGFDRDWWVARIAGFYEGFQAEFLARTGKARWAEKDPTYTLILDLIDELFPDAQYIHLLRDGHDVVACFRDRWGYRSAARAARGEWARYVRAARAFGARLPAERFLELRYEQLVARSGDRGCAGSSSSSASPGIPRCSTSTRPNTTRPSATAASPPRGGRPAARARRSTARASGREGRPRSGAARDAPPRSGRPARRARVLQAAGPGRDAPGS